jgi:hypothetical protein
MHKSNIEIVYLFIFIVIGDALAVLVSIKTDHTIWECAIQGLLGWLYVAYASLMETLSHLF